jgi:hypothetical protein
MKPFKDITSNSFSFMQGTYRTLLIIFFFILGSITALIFMRKPAVSALNNTYILSQPQPFTELYFKNHLSLPQRIPVNSPQQISFVIRNVEGKSMTYPYVVSLTNEHGKTLLDEQIVTIGANQTKTITQSFSIASPSSRTQLIVDLPTKKQHITYWLNVSDESE